MQTPGIKLTHYPGFGSRAVEAAPHVGAVIAAVKLKLAPMLKKRKK